MKVAYLLTTYPCRSETFVAREIFHLRDLGFDVTVLAAAADGLAESVGPAGRICYRPPWLSLRALRSLGYLLKRYTRRIPRLLLLVLRLAVSCPREAKSLLGNVHTIGWFAQCLDNFAIRQVHACFLSWPAVIGLGLLAVTGCELSLAAHARDIYVERGAVRLKVAHARFIVVCSRQGLEQLKGCMASKYHDKLVLNYHGIEAGGCPRRPDDAGRDGAGPLVAAVGRLVPKKGFPDLVKAFAEVVRDQPDSRLIFVGDGPERTRLCAMIREMSLEDSVRLTGWQDAGQVRRVLQEAAVLAVPSVVAADGDRDGIPNVILEAFAAGTPVVATDLPAIAEVVCPGRTGLLVRPGDASALSSALRRLLTDRSLGDYLSRNAREFVVERFNVEGTTQRLAELFLKTEPCGSRG